MLDIFSFVYGTKIPGVLFDTKDIYYWIIMESLLNYYDSAFSYSKQQTGWNKNI